MISEMCAVLPDTITQKSVYSNQKNICSNLYRRKLNVDMCVGKRHS